MILQIDRQIETFPLLFSFSFSFSIYFPYFYFIWDLRLYLRTSLYFLLYFRTCTYLQLMGVLECMHALQFSSSSLFFSFFFLPSTLLDEILSLNMPLGNPIGYRRLKRGPCCRNHTPKRKRNPKTLETMRTHTSMCIHPYLDCAYPYFDYVHL